MTVRNRLARSTARGQKSCTVRSAIGAHLERAVEARGRIGLRVGCLGVVRKLTLGNSIREAYALFLQELTAVIASAASARILLVGGRARFRKRKLLGLRLFKDSGSEPLCDFKF